MVDYEIVVKKNAKGFYASCPAAPDCWAQGRSEEEAREGARGMVQKYLSEKAQLLSEGPYRGLVDELISWYSWDASSWREQGLVSSPTGEAIKLNFLFATETPQYGADLIGQIATRLETPYMTDEWDDAAAIVMASEEEADVKCLLSEVMDNGELCLRHELWSKDMGRWVLIGHLPLLSSAWLAETSDEARIVK